MEKKIIGLSMVITKLCFYIFIDLCKSMKRKQLNYRALFASGVVFFCAGAVFTISVNSGVGAGLVILGCSFMIIGAINKDKWKNNRKQLS
jgi:hypothetical protein